MKLVHGIGVNEGLHPVTADGKITQEYVAWSSMLSRCSKKYQEKYPTYKGVTCSENFKSYSFFHEWCNKQAGFGNKDDNGRSWHLDKDILLRGNKVYSEDTCVFVPSRINLTLTKRQNLRGECFIGIYWCKGAFTVQCRNNSDNPVYLGRFSDEKEAFLVYKTFKEKLIKEIADAYKCKIDERVYDILMAYEVNIKD
jgi:hypothetical protein